MSILSTNQRLVKVGQEYSAGENISINDSVISSRNWTPDITYAAESAFQRATGYTDTQISALSGEVSSEVSQLGSDIQYISGVALTAHQSLEGYLTKASGDEYYQPIGSYATVSQLESTSGEIVNLIPTDYVNTETLEQTSGNIVNLIPDTSEFITNASAEQTYQPIGNYLSSNALEGYATKDWVGEQGYITGVDLSNYYTKDETSGKEELADAFANIPVGDPEVNAYVTDNSATINGTTDLVQNSSGLWNDVAVYQSNSANYLTAHQDISYKLDESAFADVSGTFLTAHQSLDGYATVEDVESATSGKADVSATIPVVDSLETFVRNTDYVGMVADRDGNFCQVIRSGEPQSAWVVNYTSSNISREVYYDTITGPWQSGGWSINPNSIYFPNLFNVAPDGLTLRGIEIKHDQLFKVDGVISAGQVPEFYIRSQGEVLSSTYGNGFVYSSVNTDFGTARLTLSPPNSVVRIWSPKFEAKNISGAGFCIEASGARGYDHNGNVTWDTTKTPASEQLVAGADSTKPSILLSPYMPKSMSAQFINAPLFSANGLGLYIGISGQNVKAQKGGVTARNGELKAEFADQNGAVTGYSQINGGDVTVYHSTAFGSAQSGTWYLTNSVQKREIEYDADTSAITAIAGSAIGGGGGVTGEFVPQSAFDELKQSYDALSSLFATYSGQWLLPNEGEE